MLTDVKMLQLLADFVPHVHYWSFALYSWDFLLSSFDPPAIFFQIQHWLSRLT